jgi:hypothetical protein
LTNSKDARKNKLLKNIIDGLFWIESLLAIKKR